MMMNGMPLTLMVLSDGCGCRTVEFYCERLHHDGDLGVGYGILFVEEAAGDDDKIANDACTAVRRQAAWSPW